MIRTRRQTLVAVATASLLFAAACGSNEPENPQDPNRATVPSSPVGSATVPTDAPSTSPGTDVTTPANTTAPEPTTSAPTTPALPAGSIGDVTLKTEDEKPVITVEAPWRTEKSEVKVVEEGSGKEITEAANVTLHYVLVSGTSGEQALTTFGLDPVIASLSAKQLPAGMQDAIVGQKVGAKLLITMSPVDGWGEQGNPEIGIAPSDSTIMYLELVDAQVPLTEAKGTAVPPVEGLPTVTMTKGKPAKITIPKGKEAPKELVAQQLIKGEGPEVKAKQRISVHYTGVTWRDGKMFDSSQMEGRGQPASFPIGTGGVIEGWDEGLVGQPVGSRVLLVVPPDLGYGPQGGRPDSGIQKDDTLVFVVDILSAQ